MSFSTFVLMAPKIATNPSSSLLRLKTLSPTPLSLRTPSKPTTLSLSLRRSRSNLTASSSPFSPIPGQNPPYPSHSPLTGSTWTITTVFALALAFPKLCASKISLLSLKLGAIHPNPNNTLSTEALGLLFFASISGGSAPQFIGAPMAVILARWVEIYICVLQIRVLLSLYPNIQWDKQPMSTIRDLCDPFLSLFRGILPPSFNSPDVSPALALLLLGMLRLFVARPGSY